MIPLDGARLWYHHPFMKERDTLVHGFRVKIDVWERFKALCKEAGTNPNKAITSFIASGSVTVKPATPKRSASLEKPIGFDAATGEPIFKRGVGPQKRKK